MYIEKVKIGNFGKLSSIEFNFSSGVNIIEGNNESGKTTVGEFIKFIFYGLSNKASDGEMTERKRHISWSSNDASGSLVINTENGRYRIERQLVPHGSSYKDNITVIDLSSNTPVPDIKSPGEWFFGIPEEVFTKTVYIRQAEGAYFDGESIGQSVMNIFYSADESINTDKAIKKLDEARAQIKHKKNTGRCRMDMLEKERDELSVRLEEARSANEKIIQNEASLRNTLQSIEKNKKECEIMSRQMRKAELSILLSKFEESNKYNSDIENFRNGKKEIVKATTVNGFFPDDEYYLSVENAKKELEYSLKAVDDFDSEQFIDDDIIFSQEVAEKIHAYGGKNSITELIEGCKSKKKTMFTAGGIAGGLTVLSAVLGVIISKFVFAFTVCCALTALICLFSAIANGKKITKIFDDFYVGNEEELYDLVAQTEKNEKAEIRRRELELYRSEKREKFVSAVNDNTETLLSLMAKWGVSAEKNDAQSVLAVSSDILSDISEIKDSIAKYDAQIEKNLAVKEHIDSQLAGYNEKDLQAEFDSIKENVDLDNIEEIKKRYSFALLAKESLNEKVTELERSLAAMKAKTDRPAELLSRLNAVKEQIGSLNLKHDAYVLAIEKLQEAGVLLRSKLSPSLAEASGEYMSALTDGKYKEIGVSDSLEMTYSFSGDGTDYTKEIDSLSSGTKDIAYVSLRLSLAKMFGKSGEKLPVIFDEAFARLDDSRLTNMLKIVEKYADNLSQAIIFTSQTREAVIMDNKKMREFNYLKF